MTFSSNLYVDRVVILDIFNLSAVVHTGHIAVFGLLRVKPRTPRPPDNVATVSNNPFLRSTVFRIA